MQARFTDRGDKNDLIKNSPDFKLRYHGVPPKQVTYSFIAVLLGVLVIVIHLSMQLVNMEKPDVPVVEVLSALVAIGVLISGIAVFAVILIDKYQKIITETEFQCLIFASSARATSDFCMIANTDKTVVYCDYNFSELFCSFKEHADALKRLVSHEGFKKNDREAVLKAIVDSKHVRVPFTLASPSGEIQKMVVSVDPLSRPGGYTVIRGYKQT
jgi:hypothetical protein